MGKRKENSVGAHDRFVEKFATENDAGHTKKLNLINKNMRNYNNEA
jgi:hypothetical protein